MASANESFDGMVEKKDLEEKMNIEFLNFKNDIFKIVQKQKEKDIKENKKLLQKKRKK